MSRVARLGSIYRCYIGGSCRGVFLIGSKEYLFRSTYKLKAQFDNVAGLTEGADVQVGGVHSGTVTGIELPDKPGDKVTVVMELDESTRAIIKQDSVASIQTEGLLGNQYMAISFGSAGQPEVKNGETIQSVPPLEMADLLKKTSGILDGKPTSHRQCNPDDSAFELGERQDRFGPGNGWGAGERQTAIQQPGADNDDTQCYNGPCADRGDGLSGKHGSSQA